MKELVAASSGESLSALSRLIGRNPAYLQQFVERGTPRMLAERDRKRLARYLGVSETVLGAEAAAEPSERARIVRLGVEASAGGGALNADERVVGDIELPGSLLRSLGVRAGSVALLRAQGWSMEPGIADGDELLVNMADVRPTRTPGVFVIRADGATLVKRVARAPGGLIVSSDHPDAPPVTAEVEVLGRVVGLARALR